jgi:nucleoside-diphosphate-sugar epimerase
MASMRFLVTGASGFIGAQVVRSLLSRQHEVVAISSQAHENVGNGLQWIQADLLCSSDIFRAVDKAAAEGLVHCAWDTTPGAYWTTPANLAWTAASLNLMNAFQKRGGQRLVVVGTSAEYCWQTTESLTESHSRLAPNSLYGICKNNLREILAAWASTQPLSWAWGRVFCPFGPEEKPARLIPKLIKRLMTEEQLTFDSGHLIRDFLSVADLGDALAALAKSSLEGPVNIASGRDMTIRELVSLIASNLGHTNKVQFDVLPDPTSEPPRIVADITRLREELGWQPQASLEQRIAETCQWWQTRIEAS